MRKHKNDIILIAVILTAALLLWLGLRLSRNGGEYAVVSIDGAETARYSLAADAQVRIGDEEHYNLLVIQDGSVYISDASCPDKLCVNQGSIKYSGQSIICLPNKVVVEITGGERSKTDAVAQ